MYLSLSIISDPAIITVTVLPKNIVLPTNTTTLTATCSPIAPTEVLYKYEWTLIDCEGVNELLVEFSGQNEQEFKLANLQEGTYKFKVNVFSSQFALDGLEGEAIGVVTVFPGRS